MCFVAFFLCCCLRNLWRFNDVLVLYRQGAQQKPPTALLLWNGKLITNHYDMQLRKYARASLTKSPLAKKPGENTAENRLKCAFNAFFFASLFSERRRLRHALVTKYFFVIEQTNNVCFFATGQSIPVETLKW